MARERDRNSPIHPLDVIEKITSIEQNFWRESRVLGRTLANERRRALRTELLWEVINEIASGRCPDPKTLAQTLKEIRDD